MRTIESSEPGPEQSNEPDASFPEKEAVAEAPMQERTPEPELCQPGTQRVCYSGPQATRGVGRCQDGVQFCGVDQSWLPCQKDRKPISEHCDAFDHDCDGKPDKQGCIDAWIQTAGDSTFEVVAEGMVLDDSGNMYITGYNSGSSVSFGSLKYNSSPFDFFVAKVNKLGQWTALVVNDNPKSSDQQGSGIARDPRDGSLVVTGFFETDITLGKDTFVGSKDMFVGKLTKDLRWQWVAHISSANSDICRSVVIDREGQIYVACGSFNPTSTQPLTSLSYTHGGKTTNLSFEQGTIHAVYILQLDASGAYIKHKALVETFQAHFPWTLQMAAHKLYQTSLAFDSKGSLYAAGSFFGDSLLFGKIKRKTNGYHDIFLVKIKENLDRYHWLRFEVGPRPESVSSLKIGPQDNLYIAGEFEGEFQLGSTTLKSVGGFDAYVAKMDTTSIQWVWAATGGGSKNDEARDIAITARGDVYLTGTYHKQIQFGLYKSPVTTPDPYYSFFLAKFFPNGTPAWVLGDGNGINVQGSLLTLSSKGDLYTAGTFQGEQMGSWLLFPFGGKEDLFISKNLHLIYGKP